jgi:tetratricopeptide (TPR) repeat protein
MLGKKKSSDTLSAAVDPDHFQPTSQPEFIHRGWQYFSLKKYDKAEADFLEALRQNPEDADAAYALALTYKSSGQGEKALQMFQKFLNLIENSDDLVRASMLRRLTEGHMNEIRNGIWNGEKGVWLART